MKRVLSSAGLYFLLMVVLSYLFIPDTARAVVIQLVTALQEADGVVVTTVTSPRKNIERRHHD